MATARLSLDDSYDAFAQVEAAFGQALDESLQPRGPEVLYELIGALELPVGSSVVDVGCGDGRHTIELARRFGFDVLGVDPLAGKIELALGERGTAAESDPPLANRVHFEAGRAEALPVADASVDLIWCREALMYVPALESAFREFHRALRQGGRGLVYQVFTGPAMSEDEADGFWRDLAAVPSSARTEAVESAIDRAGLAIDEHVVLGSEWGERAEEKSGAGTRRLLHAARLLRDPERYIGRFGEIAYRIMLGDCLWHVYRMIGKLSGSAYVFSKPAS
jgi:SAM-dependent methyltransferase